LKLGGGGKDQTQDLKNAFGLNRNNTDKPKVESAGKSMITKVVTTRILENITSPKVSSPLTAMPVARRGTVTAISKGKSSMLNTSVSKKVVEKMTTPKPAPLTKVNSGFSSKTKITRQTTMTKAKPVVKESLDSPEAKKNFEMKETTPSTDSSTKAPIEGMEWSSEFSAQDKSDPHMPAGAINSTEEREHIDYNGETKVIVRKRYEMMDGTVSEVKYLEDAKT